MISKCLRNYHDRIIRHMITMGYKLNENDLREIVFFHHVHKCLDHSVKTFFIYLDQKKCCSNLFLHKNITYYLVCLTLYITADVQGLLDNLDQSGLYKLMAKGNCDLLNRRILRNLKQIIGEFVIK